MQLFARTITGATLTINMDPSESVAALKHQLSNQTGISSEEMRLLFGLTQLDDEQTLNEAGVVAESTVTVTLRLAGGKKKKKKKNYTTPKKASHAHVLQKMRVLEYFSVNSNGKITKNKQESTEHAGCYLADHKDRMHCGRTGAVMFYKLNKDGSRIEPVQNKQKKKVEVVEIKKKKKK